MQVRFNAVAGVLVAALLLGGGFRRSAEGIGVQEGLEPGFRAPPIAGEAPDGQSLSLAALRGNAVFVNFWASWCGPCLLEMPEIQRLYARLPAGTAILTVNMTDTEQSPEAVAAFLRRADYTFPVLLDRGGRAALDYQAVALPTSVFVTPGGLVSSRHVGPLTEGAMRAKLEAARTAPPPAGGRVAPSPLPDVILIGQWPLNTTILALLAGLMAAYFWGVRRLRALGQDGSLAGDIISGLALGGFLGAKLVAVAAAPAAYLDRPLLLLAQEWTPASMGGAAAGAIGWAAWELRRSGAPLAVLDRLAAPVLAGAGLALLPLGLAHGVLLAAAAAVAAAEPEAPGHGALLGALAGSTALVIAEFTRPAATVAAGLTVPQLGLGALGLAAWAGVAWLRRRAA